jgi:hypothetical protein
VIFDAYEMPNLLNRAQPFSEVVQFTLWFRRLANNIELRKMCTVGWL